MRSGRKSNPAGDRLGGLCLLLHRQHRRWRALPKGAPGIRLATLGAALLCLSLVSPAGRAQDNSGVYQDEFYTGGDPAAGDGGDSFSTGDLPGSVGGGPCEDTSEYDRIYGGPPVRIELTELRNELYQRHPEILLRCAADRCAINETALCWIDEQALAEAKQDPGVSDEYSTESDDSDDDIGCPALAEWTAEQQAWWNQTYCTQASGNGAGGGNDGFDTGGDQPPDDSKSITRTEPDPDPTGTLTADVGRMTRAMDTCLRSKGHLSFYQSPTFKPASGTVGYDPTSQSIEFDAGWLASMEPYDQAYALGNALAAHVLTLEARRYGDRRSSWESQQASDYITGYLAHCIERRGLVPTPTNEDNMLQDYQAYILQYGFPANAADLEAHAVNFNEGWEAWGMRLPDWLTHTAD